MTEYAIVSTEANNTPIGVFSVAVDNINNLVKLECLATYAETTARLSKIAITT
jgi:hypothetical protein